LKTVNSFDIFDTLITRWYKDPDSIFDQMEKILKIPGFKKIRKQSQHKLGGQPTLDKIYINVQKTLELNDIITNVIKNLEIKLEYDMSAPIMENIRKVQEDDILISDMYLPHETIVSMLAKNGIKKYDKLYLTANGKRQGTIWNSVHEKIDVHTGDHVISDFRSPRENNIKAHHYTKHHFTEFEQKIDQINTSVSRLCRLCRLQNPYSTSTIEGSIWDETCRLTIPFNVFATYNLNEYIEHNNYTRILFGNRDCYYMKKIYESVFRNTGADLVEYHTSRRMYYYPTTEYLEYCKNILPGSLVVDVFGTSRSYHYFINKHNFDDVHALYIVRASFFNDFKITHADNFFHSGGNAFNNTLEFINYAPFGTLKSYKNGPIYSELEYSYVHASVIEAAVTAAADLIKSGFELNVVEPNIQLKSFLNLFNMKDCKFLKYMNHVNRHDGLTLPGIDNED